MLMVRCPDEDCIQPPLHQVFGIYILQNPNLNNCLERGFKIINGGSQPLFVTLWFFSKNPRVIWRWFITICFLLCVVWFLSNPAGLYVRPERTGSDTASDVCAISCASPFLWRFSHNQKGHAKEEGWSWGTHLTLVSIVMQTNTFAKKTKTLRKYYEILKNGVKHDMNSVWGPPVDPIVLWRNVTLSKPRCYQTSLLKVWPILISLENFTRKFQGYEAKLKSIMMAILSFPTTFLKPVDMTAMDQTNSILCDSARAGLCQAVQYVLRGKPSALVFGVPPCSSFIWLNSATSKRSKKAPFGDTSRSYVNLANQFLDIDHL